MITKILDEWWSEELLLACGISSLVPLSISLFDNVCLRCLCEDMEPIRFILFQIWNIYCKKTKHATEPNAYS